MLLARLRDGRTTLARLLRQPAPIHVRTKVTALSLLEATTPTAKKLAEIGLGQRSVGRKKADALRAIDPRRVNIVSEELCDDIVSYLGPSLERHRGCDLVDLNPGVGLWSRKLHNLLEPRSHIMMDLDADLYRPFLEDLLSKDNVHLIPKSGVVWKDLLEMIRTHLSHQPELSKDERPTRNDTLLVTANLSTFPKKVFQGFDSVSTMVTYQLMSSIRTSSLFQRYGLVRMLIWINDEDKRRLLPKSINRRKRSSFEVELACEWVHEVAGQDAEVQDRNALRDDWINVESGYKTLERMMAQGMTMPAGRETRTYTDCKADLSLLGQKLAGVHIPSLARPFKQELEELEQEYDSSAAQDIPRRLKDLRNREKYGKVESLMYLQLLQEREAAMQLSVSSPKKFAQADAAWNEKIENLKKNPLNEFNVLKDSYHLFRQDPPALLWDRRAYEPLSARDDDFFPNAPTALIDIQPKAMHPLLLQHGPNSSRSGDMSEIMLRFWFHQTLLPVQKAMETVWGGFGDLITECPSVRDLSCGGSPMTGHGELAARAMNERQWTEIMQAWMNWPFRPTYAQLLSRMVEDSEEGDEEETKSGATSVNF